MWPILEIFKNTPKVQSILKQNSSDYKKVAYCKFLKIVMFYTCENFYAICFIKRKDKSCIFVHWKNDNFRLKFYFKHADFYSKKKAKETFHVF